MIEIYVLVTITCGFKCPVINMEEKPSISICELERKYIEETRNPDRTIVFCTKIVKDTEKKI